MKQPSTPSISSNLISLNFFRNLIKSKELKKNKT